MNQTFTRTYFYVLLGLSILFIALARIFDYYDLYSTLTYHTDVLPVVLFTGAFALICVLSLFATALFVRKAGQTPPRFSWINTILFLLFCSFCLFMFWQVPRSCTLTEYIQEFYSDWILLGSCSVVGVILTSAISYIIRQTKNQSADDAMASRTWYTTFMLLSLIMAFIYLAIGMIIFEWGYDSSDAYFVMHTVIIVNIASGMVVALLSHYGSIIVEKNKSIAFLVQIFVTIVFLLPHIWGIGVSLSYVQKIPLTKSDQTLFAYTMNDESSSIASDMETESHDYEPEPEPEIDPEYFYSAEGEDFEQVPADMLYHQAYNPLWYESDSREENIYGVFRSMRDKMTAGYFFDDMNPSYLEATDPEDWGREYYYTATDDDILFHQALKFISLNRKSLPLASLLKAYEPIMRMYITDKVYHDNGYEHLISLLIHAYNNIERYSDENTRHTSPVYENIYDIMCVDLSDDPERYTIYARKIAVAAHLVDSGDDERLSDFDTYFDSEEITWSYSFWARRWSEGTISRAWDAISVLTDMYSQQE